MIPIINSKLLIVSSLVKLRELLLELLNTKSQHLISVVQSEFEEEHKMPVIMSKEETIMLTAC